MADESLLPGFVPRAEYMKRVHGKSDWTGRRWQDAGRLVVTYFGRTPFVDVVATIARTKGEDRPKRRRLGGVDK